MGSALSGLCRALYATILALNMLWATGVMKLVYLLPLAKPQKEGMSLLVVQLAWRLTILFTPWVWCTSANDMSEQWERIIDFMDEAAAEAKKMERPIPPLFVLGNHSSFFDSLLAASKFPSKVLWRCRTYMDHGLFKLPIMSTLCYSVGHFPVYFKSGEDGVFKVDNEMMEQTDKKVNRHLDNGGWLCFFPEGQMNKNPDVLMPFRYGGIKKALELDARLASFMCYGNHNIWPRKEMVGGRPGRVRYSMNIIAPKGARALVAELRAQASAEDSGLADHEFLAKYLHCLLQGDYDDLKLAVTGQSALKAD